MLTAAQHDFDMIYVVPPSDNAGCLDGPRIPGFWAVFPRSPGTASHWVSHKVNDTSHGTQSQTMFLSRQPPQT